MYPEINNNDKVYGHKLLWAVLTTAVFAVFYLWDIGNILAPRQGTESLYVQISKEMFEAKSWLTPIYRQEAHWSKPPLQYWLPMPLYALFGGFSLTIARLSMAFVSFASIGLIILLLKRQRIELNPLKIAIIFLSSFGILKFSRIFMMEIPLALFPLIGALCVFDYLKSRSKLMWFISVLSIGAGGLVKGPVSLAMGYLSLFLYSLYSFRVEKKYIFKDLILIIFSSTLVSSIWYFLCFQKYGMEFINYFFLRENLGKFGQEKSMSALKIVQGLLIYTFPWFHLISFRQIKRKLDQPLYVFIGIHFLVFFFIWFIPSQKSHHYAMPGFVFWMLFLLNNSKSFVRSQFSRFLFWFQISLLILVSIIILYFSDSLINVGLALIPILVILFSIKLNMSSVGIGFSFVALYTVLASRFYLPLIPNVEIEKRLQNKNIQVFYNDRRPFFLEERIGRKVEVYQDSKFASGDYILTPINRMAKVDATKFERIQSWDKWKRKAELIDLIQAIKLRDLKPLKSTYVLYKVK